MSFETRFVILGVDNSLFFFYYFLCPLVLLLLLNLMSATDFLNVRTLFNIKSIKKHFSSSFLSAATSKPTLTRNPKDEVMYRRESVTFMCTVDSSSEWDFLWFHNGTEIPGSNSTYTIPAIDHLNNGEYRCKARNSTKYSYTEQSDPITLQVSGKPHVLYKWCCCQCT